MTAHNIELWVYSRANASVSIKARHEELFSRLNCIEGPLGVKGMTPPSAPDCGENLVASFGVKYPIQGLKLIGTYLFRGERYKYADQAKFDDHLRFQFKSTNKQLDYHAMVHSYFPEIVKVFDGYRAFVSFDGYQSAFYGGYHPDHSAFGEDGNLIRNNAVYNELAKGGKFDVDGRNNIFTLRAAQYWDSELCHRALGYGPDQVMARLSSVVPRVDRLMDGVYVVFSDNPEMSYEDFLDMNQQFKPILGLR